MKLEYYVINYNFNDKKVERVNIFYKKIIDDVKKMLDNFINYEDFKNKLNSEFKYYFWSKAECEIVVGDLCNHSEEDLKKIDIYYQIEKNLDIIAKYCIEQYNHRKYGRSKI